MPASVRRPVKIVAIDQSYSRLGYCVMTKYEVLEINSVDMRKLKNPTQKRNCVKQLVSIMVRKYEPNAILIERVRIFQGGYISAKTAGMLSAMSATIVDAAYMFTFRRKPTPVFSIDTRAWKKAVLGNPNASKQDAVDWARSQIGEISENIFGVVINHDAADAYCIGRFLWQSNGKGLQRER